MQKFIKEMKIISPVTGFCDTMDKAPLEFTTDSFGIKITFLFN